VHVASFEGAARKRGRQTPRLRLRLKRGYSRGGPAAEVAQVLGFTPQAFAEVEPDLRAGFAARVGTQRAWLVRRSLGEVGKSRSTSDTVHLFCAVTGSARFLVPPLSTGCDQDG